MPKGNNGLLGIKRGKYKKKTDGLKEKALSLLDMFKSRIENGDVEVDVAEWWITDDISTFRLDIKYLDNS